MNASKLQGQATSKLLAQFCVLGIAKGEAILERRIASYTKLYREVEAIEEELKKRSGDQRGELTQFYDHPDPQVRLDAALATLAIFPEQAQAVLQTIVDRSEFPQAADAQLTLMNVKEGARIPD